MSDIERVAIIGIAGRFPGAASVDAFWRNLRDGVESISFFSEEELIASGISAATLRRPNYVRASAVLDEIEMFDAPFFGFTPREAEITDPQQRLFLECAWEVMEDAGYVAEDLAGRIGVFAGAGPNRYLLKLLMSATDLGPADVFQFLIGNERDHLPAKISYKLNLTGPSINIQTACSTSLVAVALACQSLLSYQCDAAIAGGVSLALPQKAGYFYEEGGVTSPDGHCRAFDARAGGAVVGSGAGVVLLKRYSEALANGDNIQAVIRGAAINNDGAARVGYTAPGVDGQATVIAEALAVAGVEPESVGYVETHGTATPLGDPIEIAALTKAYRGSGDRRTAACAIGSVKTNVGHLDAAAGIAGLIKTVAALKHKQLPPSLHFESANPEIDFDSSPFYVNRVLSEWPRNETPRRAGVSSFGIGGTNAHLVLEEAPPRTTAEEILPASQLLVLSARSRPALDQAATNLAVYLRQNNNAARLADVAFTLQIGRKAFAHRLAVVGHDSIGVAEALEARKSRRVFFGEHKSGSPRVAMMFPGQGAQHLRMAAGLYRTMPVFRRELDFCAEVLRPHVEFDLLEVLSSDVPELLSRTSVGQPALFSISYALAKLWASWGVRPFAMIGHSMGEYVAACLAGVFSPEEALWLVAERGRLAQQLSEGAMLAVALDQAAALQFLPDGLSLVAINGPAQCVLAGDPDAVKSGEEKLTTDGVACLRLPRTRAFHSPMVEPMLPAFKQRLECISMRPPAMPYVSTVTGTWITPAEATSSDFWIRQCREPVRFADGVRTLCAAGASAFLEVGPGQTLASLVRRHPDKTAQQVVLTSLTQGREEPAAMLEALGQLWTAGVEPDWSAVNNSSPRYRVSLPTYPFERRRHWVDTVAPQVDLTLQSVERRESDVTNPNGAPAVAQDVGPQPSETESKIAAIWQEVFGLEHISIDADFFELGGNSLAGLQLISRIRKAFNTDLTMRSFFEAPTIAGLARLIEEQVKPEAEEDLEELEELLREIEGMSPEDLESHLGPELSPQ